MASSSSSRHKSHVGGSGQEADLAIIACDLRVEGVLTSRGVIRIEGTVVGTVRAERQVLVVKGGTVEGDIYTPEAILDGEVRGSILAEGRVELHVSAVIHGDITTPRLGVAEGATVCGHIHMERLEGAPDPAHKSPPA
jgi:cytoskeletal protein CcmA (bactofilin family)